MRQLTALSPVLVANRGEIAVRISWTCRKLGLEVYGVHTDEDARMPHIEAMDRSSRIEDYLDGRAIIEAAQKMGARSIHPGFGFLAENAGFAAQVVEAGLVWIGPGAEAIEIMGSKRGARQRVAANGVAVVPGYDGEAQDDATLAAEAERIGFPVMVKASAGGGGKGMGVVRTLAELSVALEQARRVSMAAFGDDQLLLERYIQGGRHIEVQILADSHGQTVHLFERECSIQRRRQKIIEEAPSPACLAEPVLRQRPGCRHRGIHRHRPRGTLLPGDEYPPAGRAPGHRGHHRPRPGGAATQGGCGPGDRDRWFGGVPGWPRHRGPHLRRGSRKRLPPLDRAGPVLVRSLSPRDPSR
jgi:3-methylcrotonyl-CoA carboxylase alpha subunit